MEEDDRDSPLLAGKGIDGFRCDMAEMVPHEFWEYATNIVKQIYPDIIFIGEVYDTNQYKTYVASGFDYLYDKVGMYDCLRAVTCHQRPASSITHEWQLTDDIGSHMLYFLENHDEQRLASDFFAGNGMKGIPALIVATMLKSNPMMVYAGQEFGERPWTKKRILRPRRTDNHFRLLDRRESLSWLLESRGNDAHRAPSRREICQNSESCK